MPTTVDVNGTLIDFPDSMSRDEIKSVLQKKFSKPGPGGLETAGEHALSGIAPGAAFAAAAPIGAKGGAAAGALIPGLGETGLGELGGAVIGALVSGGIASWAAYKAQHAVIKAVAPNFADAMDKRLAQGAEAHPIAAIAGDIAANIPSMEMEIPKLAQLPFRAALGGTIGGVMPLAEGRKPTTQDVAEGAIMGSVFGESRFPVFKEAAKILPRAAAETAKTDAVQTVKKTTIDTLKDLGWNDEQIGEMRPGERFRRAQKGEKPPVQGETPAKSDEIPAKSDEIPAKSDEVPAAPEPASPAAPPPAPEPTPVAPQAGKVEPTAPAPLPAAEPSTFKTPSKDLHEGPAAPEGVEKTTETFPPQKSIDNPPAESKPNIEAPNETRPNQPHPPGLDVREPAPTGGATPPTGGTGTAPGGQERPSRPVGAEAATGNETVPGRSPGSIEQPDTGPPRRPGDERQPANAHPAAGEGEDRSGAGTRVEDQNHVLPQEEGDSGPIKSMGGLAPGDPEEPAGRMSQLDILAHNMGDLAGQNPRRVFDASFDLGASLASAKDSIKEIMLGLRAVGKVLKRAFIAKPVVTSLHRALGDRHLKLSESATLAREKAKVLFKALSDKTLQAALSKWIDTGGDEELLRQAMTEGPQEYRKNYARALQLTDREKEAARDIQDYFDGRAQDAIEAGLFNDAIENYVHRIYPSDSPFRRGILAELSSGIYNGKPSLAKHRVFEYDHEAEAAGLHPEQSVIKRILAYDLSLNKALADRQAVKNLMEVTMPDGRPMFTIGGRGRELTDEEGNKSLLVNPRLRTKKIGDYRAFDAPALKKWKWVDTDEAGKNTFVMGDVLVHPDALRTAKALFEPSAIRQRPGPNQLLKASSVVKQTMLDISGFHPVQIFVHALEHQLPHGKNPMPVKEIDFNDPNVRGLIKGGMTVGETSGRQLFSEGLSGSSLTKHLPVIGERLQNYQEWLFNSFIPRLKVRVGLDALERNRKRYPNLTDEELHQKTADEMNAAFGGQNWEMLGHSRTMQDMLRLTMFSPDFTVSRGKFAAQALTWYGREQTVALMAGASALYITARIINKILDDDYHMEKRNMFNVVYGGKASSIRTVQGDILRAATEPGQFVSSRLNPVYTRPILEFITGRDYFGRKRNGGEQAEDEAKTIIPISAKGLFSGREQTVWESLMNAFGVTEHRDSSLQQIMPEIKAWKDQHGFAAEPGEFIYDPEKDRFHNIRLAASPAYGPEAIRAEVAKAEQEGVSASAIRKHFYRLAISPLTGSHKHDQEFLKTASADEREEFIKAQAEKRELWQRVKSALSKSE